MSAQGCLDDNCACIDWEACCECACCDRLRENRNPISSASAGILFAIGWWLMIDAAVNSDVDKPDHAMGVMSTVALFMVNAISNSQLTGDTYDGGALGPTGAKIWLIIGLMMTFACLIASAWIMASKYIDGDRPVYAGVALFLQNVLIFASSMLFKFGRGNPDSF